MKITKHILSVTWYLCDLRDGCPLPSGHSWKATIDDYQYQCQDCNLEIFRRKFELGGGWGISVTNEFPNDFEFSPPIPHMWAYPIPVCKK